MGRKLDVLFARFPFGDSESHFGTNWLIETVCQAKADPRIGRVLHAEVDDTPIPMSRNRVLYEARGQGADLVLMLDSDVAPDLPGPGARPFWPTALDFMLGHEGPCTIASPYCGPPPHENVFVFLWRGFQSDHPGPDYRLEQFTREEAAARAGFEEVAALPTGLMLIDIRCLDSLTPPWFDYEYVDPPYNTRKATTEDVYFTRNLSLAGVPQYCLWDAWAGHRKKKTVGRPVVLPVDAVRESCREAVRRGRASRERLVDVSRANGFTEVNDRIGVPDVRRAGHF